MARRSRDCFYGGAAGAGAADQEKRRGTQEDGPQQLQQPDLVLGGKDTADFLFCSRYPHKTFMLQDY